VTRIVVVGGVAGGMSAAARARRLDENAEVIVLERGAYVSFANCGLPYHISGEIDSADRLLVQTPERLRAALNLDVRTHHDVIALDTDKQQVTAQTADGLEVIDYDHLILSPGAVASRPPIDGLDSPRVVTLRTVEDAVRLRGDADAGAKRAVVLGAGFIGVEAAEAFAMRGIDTTLVEFADHVLPPLDYEHAWPVEEELRRIGVDVRTSIAAKQIIHEDAADEVVLSDGTSVTADVVVLATGVRPDTAVFEAAGIETERGAIITDEHGRTNKTGVWAVGDATLSTDAVTGIRRPVALAGPANRAGRQIADAILRPETARPLPKPLGTAIVRVGELTVAMTGANRAGLETAGIKHHTVHLHPNQHAGYFPGAAMMHMSVHFGVDGLLLGAQIVGAEGADKRIDVLATAIRAGMHVDDLIDLDLAYSPPYGQAKDAVNLTGMLGANVLDGTVRLWYPHELERARATAQILDVRTSDEFVTGHLPEAIHIPHTELRERLGELDRDRPVRVLCASGVRSAIAHRLLTQEGFDSATLSGGSLTLRAALGKDADGILVTESATANA
jgi:NADPH-dependent 2,4-dienoyl-CoA reductase/sulfur reductase-like enzyme/rhodanese-related sulfurtransferase